MTRTAQHTYRETAESFVTSSVTAALLRRLADDLHILLDAAWIIAWEEDGGELQPVCRIGDSPDPALCCAEVRRELDRAEHPTHIYEPPSSATPVLVFPVRCCGRLAGAVAAGKRRRGTYANEDATLMAEACKRVGDLLEEPTRAARLAGNVMAMEQRRREMQTAREVQNRFFPARLPALPGVDCYGECLPCAEVGGDFFDLRAIGTDRLALAIGDVSGKGVPAAIIMAGMQVSLRGLSARNLSPLRIAEDLNRLVCAISPDNFFASMFYAQIDISAGYLRYINAGHEPPLLIRHDTGRIERLSEGGTVLGLSRRVKFVEGSVRVAPGDWLLAVTDGVTDARAEDGEYFDAARVAGAVDPARLTRASEAVAAILNAVDSFAAEPAPDDDRTAVAVHITGALRAPLWTETRVAEPLQLALAAVG